MFLATLAGGEGGREGGYFNKTLLCHFKYLSVIASEPSTQESLQIFKYISQDRPS